ncbi:MAG: hypothetical protein JXA67_16480 [Micromonosporaceae bacterium]|nr:hypothetical protein [Micromonosporaceae bacterium]
MTTTLDPVDLFTGDAAMRACQQDGQEPDAEWCNDYYIRNNNKTTVTVTVSDNVTITLYHTADADHVCGSGPSTMTPCSVSLAELASAIAARNWPIPAEVTVTGGAVAGIAEIYFP